jgi:hypothetical protein
MKQGFEEAYFINKSNNQTKQLWRGEKLEAEPFDNRRLTENFIKEAIQFVEKNKDRPFFAYLPLSAPHFPAQAHPDWNGKSAHEAYGDVVEEINHHRLHIRQWPRTGSKRMGYCCTLSRIEMECSRRRNTRSLYSSMARESTRRSGKRCTRGSH